MCIPDNIDEIISEATIDAHDIQEQFTSLKEYISDHFEVPFAIRYLGEDFEVTETVENYGLLKFVVSRNGVEYVIEATDIEIKNKNNPNVLLLEAYTKFFQYLLE